MSAGPNVGLFVTCLVDLMRPSIGFATLRLLQAAGCRVRVPDAQTCCGQPASNNGDRANARRLALRMIDLFEGCQYVVAPSGSCVGQVRRFPTLLQDDAKNRARAELLAQRCMELSCFLTEIVNVDVKPRRGYGPVTYHDSCAGLRELGIKKQPRALLERAGIALVEMQEAESCCGFGGTFCVKYPDVAEGIVRRKTKAAASTGATVLAAGDLGCLLHIGGSLSRQNSPIVTRHVAEVLAGDNGLRIEP